MASLLNADFIAHSGIFFIVLNLKTKPKTVVHERLPYAFLRRFEESLAEFVTVMFRDSFSSVVLPNDWLPARIVTLLKKGERLPLSNYSTISLTRSLCKLSEHVI